jgi:hypothetical protein
MAARSSNSSQSTYDPAPGKGPMSPTDWPGVNGAPAFGDTQYTPDGATPEGDDPTTYLSAGPGPRPNLARDGSPLGD